MLKIPPSVIDKLTDGTPSNEGDSGNANGHPVRAVPSRLPRDQLVWECKDCGTRGEAIEDFQDIDCTM